MPNLETISQSLAAPRPLNAPRNASPEEAKALGTEFESIFIARMLAPMFDSLPTDGPFGGGGAEAMFRSLLVDQYAGALVRRGGFGIAASVQQEILRIQEKANG